MSRPATSRLKVNPPLGSPPTLEWRPLAELSVDPVYQRSVLNGSSNTLIRRIAQFWDWGLCQPLAVARRADGSLMVVDGQHRLEAARMRRDVAHLPCVITSYTNAGDEAAAFVALNQQRRPLTAIDLFRAAIAASDVEALAVMAAITDAGLKLATSTNLATVARGSVSNVGGLQRCYRRQGEAVLRAALAALSQAWPGDVLRYAGTIFPGLAAVAWDEIRLGSVGSEFVKPLADIAKQRSQLEWRAFIKASVGESGGMAREASEMVFRQQWADRPDARSAREASSDEKLKAFLETPLVVAPPKPATAEMLPAERAWCNQCDEMVSGAKVAKCASPFCKLKRAAAA